MIYGTNNNLSSRNALKKFKAKSSKLGQANKTGKCINFAFGLKIFSWIHPQLSQI